MSSIAFRQYDIRGLVGPDLDAEFYHRLGLAFGTRLAAAGARSVVIGRDARPDSAAFSEALMRGLVETGRRVLDLGFCTTPQTVFGLNYLGADASVAVTASHNPAEYNGAKLRQGAPVYGEELQALRALFEAGQFTTGRGEVEEHQVDAAYLGGVLGRVNPKRSLKVVLDGGNGSGGPIAETVLRRLGFDVVPLYCEPDGAFPNHHPDPTKLVNLKDLKERILEERADCGVALDGDADRVVLLDEQGAVHWPDRVLMAMAAAELPGRPGSLVACDVKCSQGVEEVVSALGGKAVMVKTGYPFMLEAMAHPDALLGAELSGHSYFGQDPLFNFDDGVFTACRMLEVFSRSADPVSSQFDSLPHFVSTPEIRATCPEAEKFEVTDGLLRAFEADSEVESLLTTDGARVTYPEGWGLVRASNTEPSLVLVFESKTEDGLQRVKQRFADKLAAFPSVEVDLA